MNTRSYVSLPARALRRARCGVDPAQLGGLRADPQRRQILRQHARRGAVTLHENRACGTTRERLDAERAAAREQVEHARTGDLAEHREERLAHPLGRSDA